MDEAMSETERMARDLAAKVQGAVEQLNATMREASAGGLMVTGDWIASNLTSVGGKPMEPFVVVQVSLPLD